MPLDQSWKLKLDESRKAYIIMAMDKMKLTEKETDNLRAWKRWGLQMKLLKSIHREIAPQKKFLHEALN